MSQGVLKLLQMNHYNLKEFAFNKKNLEKAKNYKNVSKKLPRKFHNAIIVNCSKPK